MLQKPLHGVRVVEFEGIGPGRNTAFFRGIVPAGAQVYWNVKKN